MPPKFPVHTMTSEPVLATIAKEAKAACVPARGPAPPRPAPAPRRPRGPAAPPRPGLGLPLGVLSPSQGGARRAGEGAGAAGGGPRRRDGLSAAGFPPPRAPPRTPADPCPRGGGARPAGRCIEGPVGVGVGGRGRPPVILDGSLAASPRMSRLLNAVSRRSCRLGPRPPAPLGSFFPPPGRPSRKGSRRRPARPSPAGRKGTWRLASAAGACSTASTARCSPAITFSTTSGRCPPGSLESSRPARDGRAGG